jgi:hypothetical protein
MRIYSEGKPQQCCHLLTTPRQNWLGNSVLHHSTPGLGPLLLRTYKNYLPPAINTFPESITSAGNTSVTISGKNFDDSCAMSNIIVLSHMSKWFTANKLVLKLEKSHIIKFITTVHHNTFSVLVTMESIHKRQ